ncbi:NAD(P)/FAD-dependent oxidoreductase [Litoribrevibacter albus]|uniref:FAD dependent oxidoreductase domain-containing protein n=1 Tax=Litoribrevibacter albus TaxID=1473156 RepID=A0AA37W882_9GAMM|nr:NAD(P)/FAD-dependent oxidoreductase [Litoribrevibacter albus]GLQ33535.1 hypothetical protein GCM10007876_40150 [Litoribrevibacter albus]
MSQSLFTQKPSNTNKAHASNSNSTDLHTDYLVIGAGVVGLAIAKRLSDAGKECLVVEKNALFGEETSSRNSEVIHAGIYYPSSSLKARLCVEGKRQLYRYCQQRSIDHSPLGKLIVATSSDEEEQLSAIHLKAQANGVFDLEQLTQTQVNAREPNVKATSALLSPSTGIIDAHQYMLSLVGDIEDAANAIVYKAEVTHIEQHSQGWTVAINNQGEALTLRCRWLINAAGLHANALATMYSSDVPAIHYCRGLYFSYTGHSVFHHLIYPVPEKNTVGLGIHATLDMAGQVKFGPDTQYLDTIDYRMPESTHLDAIKSDWVTAIQRYYPALDANKLHPSYAGIRPKLSGPGDPAEDFLIEGPQTHGLPNLIHLLGIESPGLTASLAVAEYVLQLIDQSE